MEIENHTPFPALAYFKEYVRDDPRWIAVVRGTFAMEPGALLEPVPEREQTPLVLADTYRGDPRSSSLLAETDLVVFKPRTDVIVEAVAHAPRGEPAESWLVGVRVASLTKTLRVTGPRTLRFGATGWSVSKPSPCTEVPVHYELAFGGVSRAGDEVHTYAENPVGRGFVHGGDFARMPLGSEIPAPQIEAPDQPIDSPSKRYAPEGLGPIARTWQPRLARAGTFDERWERERHPHLPADFDYAFFNAAHPELTCDGYLSGGESVAAQGLSPEGSLAFRLPRVPIEVEMVTRGGRHYRPEVVLDTVHLDYPQRRAYLVWRAFAREEGSVRIAKLIVRS